MPAFAARSKTRLATACFLLLPSLGLAQQDARLRSDFKTPAKQYRPMVRWWWPGTAVTDAEIAREVGLLDSDGFGGAEIQPFVTFDVKALPPDVAAQVNDYATPSFFAHVRAATDAAKAHGMWIDYTFGSGWPFGGGLAITPELAAIELRSEDTEVTGPKAFNEKLALPDWKPGLIASMMKMGGIKPDWPADWQERMDARSKVVAVVAIRSGPANPTGKKPDLLDGSSAVVLTDKLKADGTLEWQVPAGDWHIFAFRQIPTRQPVIGAAGTGPQLVLDHLNPAAFAAHAKRVGEPLAAIAGMDAGKSLRSIFCDSLELQQYVFWSDDFLAQFKQRRGYDLTPYLAILRQPGYNDFYFSHPDGLPLYDIKDGGDAIRSDYWKTVSELIFEGFYHPFDEWAAKHKFLSRVQAHGAPGDLLKIYGDAAIPETEQLEGNNTVNFMKLASSAGYDYGKKIVSSESFVFRGNPYVTTPESIKANADKLVISGINQIIYHGFPYVFDDGTKGLGWFPFQGQFSSQINEQNPIWPFVGKVNEYITRLQYIAQQGRPQLQIALFRSALNQEDTGPTPATGEVKDPFPGIEAKLTAAGYSFGFVNDDALRGSTVVNRVLTTKGAGKYSALLIPHEANASEATVKSLLQFAEGRLPMVLVGGSPGALSGFPDHVQRAIAINDGLKSLAGRPEVKAATTTDDIVPALARISPQLRFLTGDVLPFAKLTVGADQFYFVTNPTPKQTETTIAFSETSVPQNWDLWTAQVHSAASTRQGQSAELKVSLPPYGSQLIAFGGAHAPSLPMLKERKEQELGQAGWVVDAKGNSGRGIGITEHVVLPKLVDWLNQPELKTFSGRATYTTHIAVAADDLESAKSVMLSLGEVKDAAEVKVNGVAAATLVVHPFSTDIRSLLHAGDNEVQITVANSLTNYVSTIQFPKNPVNPMAHYPPISAGLLGPVNLTYSEAANPTPASRAKERGTP